MDEVHRYAKPQRGSWCLWWGCSAQPFALAQGCVRCQSPHPHSLWLLRGNHSRDGTSLPCAHSLSLSKQEEESEPESLILCQRAKQEQDSEQGTGVSKRSRAFFHKGKLL